MAVAALLLLAGCAGPADQPPNGDVAPVPEADTTPACRNMIVDEGVRPLHGVHVQIVGTAWFAVTNGAGFFSWEGAPDGNWTVTYGAGDRTGSVDVRIEDECPVPAPGKMELWIGPRKH